MTSWIQLGILCVVILFAPHINTPNELRAGLRKFLKWVEKWRSRNA